MESLSDTKWDVVISGTGLQPSLLALALSRSGKNILHIDPNSYYGGAEAVLSLQEADDWAEQHQSADADGVFAAAKVHKTDGTLSPRGFSLALAPQLIHARSDLLSQLVASKAFRQVEFLAVGSFYVYHPASETMSAPTLARVPSTREDVFSNTAISARSKRALMKFMKFVLDYESDTQIEVWNSHAEKPLSEFLASEFKLDNDLQSFIVALTLSLDGKISVNDGLKAISRHLTSMGAFGAGFAAVYPKWGGLSEIAQVGCRAAAVGGAVYMLGTGIGRIQQDSAADDETTQLSIMLSNETTVNSKTLVQESASSLSHGVQLSRLTAVVDASLPSLFEVVVEGAPTPSVGVVAFPPGSVIGDTGVASDAPIYAMAHSSDTGECPSNKCIIYLSTISSPASRPLLEKALEQLLVAVAGDEEPSKTLYLLSYEQRGGSASVDVNGSIATFGPPSLDLAFNDSVLKPVRKAWDMVHSRDSSDGTDYMKFEDREGQDEDDVTFDS